MSYKLFPHSFMCQDRKASLSFCGFSFPLIIVSLLFLLAQSGFCSQESWTKDTLLYEENFDSESLDNWKSELQKPDVSVVEIQDGKLNIDVGGGATIWFKHKLEGNVLIEYDVTVIKKGEANDRGSDLNQFWMASDPVNTNLFTRSGKFSQYDNLRLYYVGMGGNNNSTTRFRRYPGGGERPLLAEYTDPKYLLQPNTDYHIEIICLKGLTQFIVNGEVYFNFKDPDPLVEGNFGFRTVRNHETVDNFKVYRLVESKLSTLTINPNAADRTVMPGESIQDAIDHVSANGGGIVTLAAGVHNITSPVQITSNVTLQGEGNLASALKTTSDIKMIIQAGYGLMNVTIRNLVLIGSPTKKAGGIHLISYDTDHDRIRLSGVHVFETGWGVHIKGAKNVSIENCNFSRNGNPQSKRYAHNLYLRRCYTVNVSNCIFNNSTSANGINISYSKNINIYNCEAIGNHFRGMRAADTDGFRVHNCVIADNGNVGLLANTEKVVTKNIDWENNCVSNNGGKGIYARSGATGICKNNNSYGNSDDYDLPGTVSQSGNVSDSSIVSSSRISAAEKSTPLRFFVSLKGNNTWSGKLERPSSNGSDGPFRSLEAARDAVRNMSLEERSKQPIEICILPGTYIRKQPLILDARDSGTEKAPIVYRSWTGKPVVISGGKEVRNWTKAELKGHSVLVCDLSKLPEGYTPFEQLWVNGHRVVQARTPNLGYLKIPSASEVEPNSRDRGRTYDFSYVPADEHYLDGVEDGVAVVFNKWLEYHMPLDRIDRENRRIICTKKSGRAIEADDDYYLEGGRAMLDRPGEWYLDRKANKLYYYPLPSESEVVAVIPSLVTVLQIEGDADSNKWVEHVHFRGLTFSHTTWVLPRSTGPSGYSQADIRMDGAVRLLDARECLFETCEITAIGNYGLEIGPGCSKNRILRCAIHDLGAGGFLIGPKIRPPSDKENVNRQDFPPVLESPSDACSHNEIADCRIYDGGRYYHCAVGIWIGQSPDNNVHHNEIYDFYYSGISSGWTWGYGRALATGNRFEYNHIHHIGRFHNGDGPVLSDLGGIYTLGDQTGTVIRHNVFHDIWAGKYGGWAIYCDEGSRNILIENNLAYHCRHSCFDQHYGKDNIIRNNIFAFADTSVVMLARAQSHTGFVLTNNILLSDDTPIYAGGYAFKVNTSGAFKADHNLVWSTTGKVLGAQDRFPSRLYEPNEPVLSWEQWQALGYDRHSIIADPGFKDPANGDFHLPEDSPASKIGFKPFPLDEAGPRTSAIPSKASKTTHAITPVVIEPEVTSLMALKWNDEFKHVEYPKQWLDNVINVEPGDNIQAAVDSANSTGGGVVLLKAGTHILSGTLTIKSKVTITGEGREQTTLMQGPDMKGTGFNAEDSPQITDLVVKDLTLKGTRTGKANGFLMRGRNESRHTRIMLQNVTVSDWSAQGIHIKRTNNIIMDNCNFQFNGSAGGLYHNVYFLYNKYILQSDCDMSFPVKGKGNKYTSTEYLLAQRCTIKDCNGNGIQSDHEQAGYLFFHKYHISGCGRVAMWFPCEHYYDKYNYTEDPKYAPQKVILNRCNIVDNTWGAMWRAVNDSHVINSTFDNKKIDMGLLKCDVTMENSTFGKGNEIYTDVKQWPSDVKLLW